MMIRPLLFALLVIVVSATLAVGQLGSPDPAEDRANIGSAEPRGTVRMDKKQQISYAVGYDFGASLRAGEADLDLQAMNQGLADGLLKKPSLFTEEELNQLITIFEKEMQAREKVRMKKYAEENKQTATSFLAKNKEGKDVQVTPSGLQYKIIELGNGPSPKENDIVQVHYRGVHLDGSEFDSSYTRGEPAQFGVGEVIKGWTEALQLMRVGGKWQLFIPPELAYGEKGMGPIGPNEVLVFEVELLGIVRQ